jgi:3-oxoacyl-[acyl-carrier-protein] synthase II
MRRVVVTGMGGISALGDTWERIEGAFRSGTSAVRYMPEWERYVDMGTRLAAPCDAFAVPEEWTRKQLRGMGRVSRLAVRAADLALADAGLAGSPLVSDGGMGVACGSCIGSTADLLGRQRQLVHPHDAAHRRGERRHLLRHQGPRDPDLECVHVG